MATPKQMLSFLLTIDVDDDLTLHTPFGPITSEQGYIIERGTESEVRDVVTRFLSQCSEVPNHGKQWCEDEFKATREEVIKYLKVPLTLHLGLYSSVQAGGNRYIFLSQTVKPDYILL